MTDQSYSLEAWRNQVTTMEKQCPWPGPRPLNADDPETLLCGRDDDRKRFRQTIDQHKLVFLTGASGVGKTSLLLRGFVPQLEKSGYVVAALRNWSGMADGVQPAEFMAERIRAELVNRYPDLPKGVEIFRELIRRFDDRIVFVLDQFEELIRDAPLFKDELFKFLAYLNQRQPVKVVISLRSEYIHELRALESMAKPFSVATYYLEELEDEYAVEVIRAANVDKPGAIDDATPQVLADAWLSARFGGPGFASRPAGLLHLQALLYVLHDHAGSGQVTAETFATLQRDLGVEAPDDERQARELFERVLQHAIDLKLERCREAAGAVSLDPYLIEGTTRMLRACVPHLSSAGYKLVREAHDLFRAAFGDDLATLQRGIARSRQSLGDEGDGSATEVQHRALFDVVIETVLPDFDQDGNGPLHDLFAPRVEFAMAADGIDPGERSWTDRLHVGAQPLAADRAEVTSGPMLGLAPAAVLIEELRRFAFALEWLQRTDIVRLSTPGTEAVMVSLVHDGFGPALQKWSAGSGQSLTAPLFGLTAPLGEDFHWRAEDDDGAVLHALDGRAMGDGSASEDGIKIFANLRWRGTRVSAHMRNVIFVNCDFRGSSFDQCSLEGVVFVNCLLDGLMITDCEIKGPVPRFDGELADRARSFEFHDVDDLVGVLSWYREVTSGCDILLANEPELPAEPAASTGAHRPLPLHRGGLTIYGGRTSSLVLRSCSFPEGGTISLRETAGSGFDVVEHEHETRIEILGSRLRHLTFTSSPTIADGGKPITITAKSSVLAQVWVGNDLSGSLTAEDCMLLDIWNGSSELDAKVVRSEAGAASRFHGLVGVKLEGAHEALIADERVRSLADVDGAQEITDIAIGMDYRRHPSMAEHRPRASAEDTRAVR